jgi:glutathione-independent formaldehyde dehydrogenase
VYVVDSIPERLAKAGELGAIPIDFRVGDPVEQILEQCGRTRTQAGATWRGEESRGGVNCGIDAIGFQACDRADPTREKPDQVIHDLARLINPNGRLGIIEVFLPNDAKLIEEIENAGICSCRAEPDRFPSLAALAGTHYLSKIRSTY